MIFWNTPLGEVETDGETFTRIFDLYRLATLHANDVIYAPEWKYLCRPCARRSIGSRQCGVIDADKIHCHNFVSKWQTAHGEQVL